VAGRPAKNVTGKKTNKKAPIRARLEYPLNTSQRVVEEEFKLGAVFADGEVRTMKFEGGELAG